ncbi:MAG: hypothetical protein HKN12_10900, partial [Gemmatimonadetes bacterium]|nr:hypothetical protein [Gemmatimonadota bacterium]
VQTTGWQDPLISLRSEERAPRYEHLENLPRVTLTDALLRNGVQYASTYAMIAVAVPLALLGVVRRRRAGDRLLFAWLLTTGGFLAGSSLLGSSHVQFGYLVLPPVCAVVAVAIADAWKAGAQPRPKGLPVQRAVASAVLAGLIGFASWRWILLFGIGTDNSYERLAAYVAENIPAGTRINSSQPVRVEPASRWLFPDHELTGIRDPEELVHEGVRYAILSEKDVWGGYGRMTEGFVSWIRENGTPVFQVYGNTYWDLRLYRLPTAPPRDTEGRT